MVMVAPGITAPEGSVTVPVREVVCANIDAHTNRNSTNRLVRRIMKMPLSSNRSVNPETTNPFSQVYQIPTRVSIGFNWRMGQNRGRKEQGRIPFFRGCVPFPRLRYLSGKRRI